MEPMLIGAALGGGISAARGGNPLTGALLGGLTGGIGSSVLGAAGAAASNAAATGLSTAGGTLAPALGSSLGAGGSAIGGATGLAAPAFTGIGMTPAATGLAAGQSALAAPAAFQGVGLTSAAAPTFMQTMREIPGSMMDYIKQNPMETMKLGSEMMKEEEKPVMAQQMPMGLLRGQQIAQQAPESAMSRPKISLI